MKNNILKFNPLKCLLALICVISINTFDCVSQDRINTEVDLQLKLLVDFLSIPNNALNPSHIDKNNEWLEQQFENLGFFTETLATESLPLLFAEKITDISKPTVLFYMHVDGQPVDSSNWDQTSPYVPVIKRQKEDGEWVNVTYGNEINPDWRIFARSASDDKGPIAMFVSALKSIQESGKEPAYNIKVIIDTMEELGSPVLAPAVKKYQEELSSDYLVVFDGPMHDSGLPTLLYGVRGITQITMEVYGPSRPQHSGHFGNYAPNPVFRAAELLASMKDEEGRVVIPGFYEGITIDSEAHQILSSVPDDEMKIQERAGFAEPEKIGKNYQESIQYPSLSVLGIRSGWVGVDTRTIVPDKVIIEMDIRTVPETDSYRLIELVKSHIESQGFTILDHQPDSEEMLSISKPVYFEAEALMFPFRTPIDSGIASWLRRSLRKVHQKKIVQIRISGGSVPLSFFINELEIPAVLVPLVNPDNNQHSPNENLRLGNYFEGIKTISSILSQEINE